MSDSDINVQQTEGRNPIILLIGFTLLGSALALLLFGGDFLNSDQAEPSNAPIPFATTQPSLSPLLGGSGGLTSGDEAPNFVLNDFDGTPVSLADFRGRPVVINFWATWCAPCRIEMPELQAAYEKYQDEGLIILALNQDEPLEVARAYFYDEAGLTFTPLLDQRHMVAAQYGAFYTLPATFFIDPQGVVTAVHRGLLTRTQLDDFLSKTIPPG